MAVDPGPFTVHGGRVDLARASYGGEDWIDLSTGIAPWAWPVDAVPLGLDRLPEPAAVAALEAAAAAAFGVDDPARVVAVPGTDLAMRLLGGLIEGQHPAVVRPGYAGHAAAWPEARAVGADEIEALADCGLLILASPANPDGHVTDPALLAALSRRMTLVVDEAYADPAPGLSPIASDRLVVLRSFGKFYGLPGVRLGFVVAGAAVVGGLRTLLGDWPVSSPAVAIGTAAYRDAAWRGEQAARIADAADALDATLVQAGIRLVGRAPLFRLVETADASALFTCLARHAILSRPFADRPDRLRLGLPRDGDAHRRLSIALEEFVS